MTVQVTYTANQAGVDRLLHNPDGPLGQWLTRLGNQAVTQSKQRANVDTGLMRSKITFEVLATTPLTGVLKASTFYAIYVHNGTRYYKGNPFLRDGLQAAINQL